MTAVSIMLPEDVKEKVTQVAELHHETLEEFMVIALMEKLSKLPDPYLEARAARGKREDFEAFLALVPDVPPPDYDRIE